MLMYFNNIKGSNETFVCKTSRPQSIMKSYIKFENLCMRKSQCNLIRSKYNIIKEIHVYLFV